jgi:hypothetical protein
MKTTAKSEKKHQTARSKNHPKKWEIMGHPFEKKTPSSTRLHSGCQRLQLGQETHSLFSTRHQLCKQSSQASGLQKFCGKNPPWLAGKSSTLKGLNRGC